MGRSVYPKCEAFLTRILPFCLFLAPESNLCLLGLGSDLIYKLGCWFQERMPLGLLPSRKRALSRFRGYFLGTRQYHRQYCAPKYFRCTQCWFVSLVVLVFAPRAILKQETSKWEDLVRRTFWLRSPDSLFSVRWPSSSSSAGGPSRSSTGAWPCWRAWATLSPSTCASQAGPERAATPQLFLGEAFFEHRRQD